MEKLEIDALDRQIAHALGLDGRASFSRVGEVLGVSDQTVARRYRRLRAGGVLRVVGLRDHRRTGGESRWWVRLQCAPGAAPGIAAALAARPDTVWVQLLSGGTELLCGIHALDAPDPKTRSESLLDRLPRSARITAVSAQSILHLFTGGALNKGTELIGALSPAQVAALAQPPPPPLSDEPEPLDDLDRALFDELGRDARVSHADLAAATGWSESSVRRRLEHLHERGVLYYDLEIDVTLLGLRVSAWLWLDVAPAELAAVGDALAGHPEVPFAVATTGATNLAAIVCCPSAEALYRYLNERIGSLHGVRRVETALVVRTVKQGATVLLS